MINLLTLQLKSGSYLSTFSSWMNRYRIGMATKQKEKSLVLTLTGCSQAWSRIFSHRPVSEEQWERVWSPGGRFMRRNSSSISLQYSYQTPEMNERVESKLLTFNWPPRGEGRGKTWFDPSYDRASGVSNIGRCPHMDGRDATGTICCIHRGVINRKKSGCGGRLKQSW